MSKSTPRKPNVAEMMMARQMCINRIALIAVWVITLVAIAGNYAAK